VRHDAGVPLTDQQEVGAVDDVLQVGADERVDPAGDAALALRPAGRAAAICAGGIRGALALAGSVGFDADAQGMLKDELRDDGLSAHYARSLHAPMSPRQTIGKEDWKPTTTNMYRWVAMEPRVGLRKSMATQTHGLTVASSPRVSM
jgi:hypothetical protein